MNRSTGSPEAEVFRKHSRNTLTKLHGFSGRVLVILLPRGLRLSLETFQYELSQTSVSRLISCRWVVHCPGDVMQPSPSPDINLGVKHLLQATIRHVCVDHIRSSAPRSASSTRAVGLRIRGIFHVFSEFNPVMNNSPHDYCLTWLFKNLYIQQSISADVIHTI